MMSTQSIYLSISLSIYLSVCLSVCLSIYLKPRIPPAKIDDPFPIKSLIQKNFFKPPIPQNSLNVTKLPLKMADVETSFITS